MLMRIILGFEAIDQTFSNQRIFQEARRKHAYVALATILNGSDCPFTGKIPCQIKHEGGLCLLTEKFSGTLVGVYATTNGDADKIEPCISRWRSQSRRQDINNGTFVSHTPIRGSH
jgi:hypothetical protein